MYTYKIILLYTLVKKTAYIVFLDEKALTTLAVKLFQGFYELWRSRLNVNKNTLLKAPATSSRGDYGEIGRRRRGVIFYL